MESLVIRKSTPEDVADIMRIYDSARRFMRSRGNPTQWSGGYPSEALVQQDIARGVSYVGQRTGQILFVFAFILGEDSTYRVIEGSWLNDAPYGTIHRLASAGVITGVFERCVAFCLQQIDNIRVDTHADNLPMQHAILRAGFSQCGIIYVADGTPRIAYQLTNK
jgi:RimJ/RimL family protein N-acetyltransferase